jgi:aminoglycoside 6-adenylyltransferase
MRSADEMLALIVQTAEQDERIRAVILNGSRANPAAPVDPFQDFDIVYLVTDMTPFVNNLEWIQRFGQLMILQMPDAMEDPPPDPAGGFAYLMQFRDGNRIDLGICPLERLESQLQDSQTILLLDKDGIIPPVPPPSDADYLPKPPTPKQFFDCCNEFWWVCPYVAKGLWRGEILYAKTLLDVTIRTQLMKMLVWDIGVKTQFSQNPGKLGKYFQRCLDASTWDILLSTYSDANIERTWDALLAMCALFHSTGLRLALHFGFDYPLDDDERVGAHLLHVRSLPREAKEIY